MPIVLTPGAMLGGYRAIEQIGKGGFSEVWSAWDTHLNRLIALKIMPRTSLDAYNTIQFGREAAMLTRLEHPHVLPLYDFGEAPDYRFLVMRYVTGGTLAQKIRDQRLPLRQVLQLMLPIASTLDYIHEQRVVHRDLKPANILLDAQESPYLADFGLAKELTGETQPVHSASGTLTYMPPEQFSAGKLSVSSDSYSFGVLLYQLFTGKLPFDGQIALGMRQLHNADRMPDVQLVNPELPFALNDLLWQLTDPDPARRPTSAALTMQHIADLFQGITGTSSTNQAALGITVALESGAYHQREARTLIDQNLPDWQSGRFGLSVTHFVLLDILLRELDTLLTPDLRSLMLRGALEYDQQIDAWWKRSEPAERQRACWHAILKGKDKVTLRAMRLALDEVWLRQADSEVLNSVAGGLMPLSDFTGTALTFLERALPAKETWQSDPSLLLVDDMLCALALSHSPLAERAAWLIGQAHRAYSMLRLPTTVAHARPALLAYEAANSLPPQMPRGQRVRLSLLLAIRQLIIHPLSAARQYLSALLGAALSIGLMTYVVYRAADPLNWFSERRMLNTLGLGVEFGIPFAFGVWLARHIAQRLRLVPFLARVALGLLAGGLVMAFSFSVFQQLNYVDKLDPVVALGAGLLYVAGFALSIDLRAWVQAVVGAAGVAAAYLLPWWAYLDNPDLRPPFIFDELHPEIVTPLVLVASGLLAFGTLCYVWLPRLRVEAMRRIPSTELG